MTVLKKFTKSGNHRMVRATIVVNTYYERYKMLKEKIKKDMDLSHKWTEIWTQLQQNPTRETFNNSWYKHSKKFLYL